MYSAKKIDYTYKKKVISYTKPIRTGGHNKKKRTKYEDMSEIGKKESDKRRIRYYKKAAAELVELALMNPFTEMITLTFSENITDYHESLTYWKNFIRRLKYSFGDFRYICVWERTKQGRIHFHCLLNLNLTHEELMQYWKYGKVVWVSKIRDGQKGKLNSIRYMTKYMVKSIQDRIESGESVRGERFFFCSKNLNKPKIEKLEEPIDLHDIIFENLENILLDGSHIIRSHDGQPINKIDFIEYHT